MHISVSIIVVFNNTILFIVGKIDGEYSLPILPVHLLRNRCRYCLALIKGSFVRHFNIARGEGKELIFLRINCCVNFSARGRYLNSSCKVNSSRFTAVKAPVRNGQAIPLNQCIRCRQLCRDNTSCHLFRSNAAVRHLLRINSPITNLILSNTARRNTNALFSTPVIPAFTAHSQPFASRKRFQHHSASLAIHAVNSTSAASALRDVHSNGLSAIIGCINSTRKCQWCIASSSSTASRNINIDILTTVIFPGSTTAESQLMRVGQLLRNNSISQLIRCNRLSCNLIPGNATVCNLVSRNSSRRNVVILHASIGISNSANVRSRQSNIALHAIDAIYKTLRGNVIIEPFLYLLLNHTGHLVLEILKVFSDLFDVLAQVVLILSQLIELMNHLAQQFIIAQAVVIHQRKHLLAPESKGAIFDEFCHNKFLLDLPQIEEQIAQFFNNLYIDIEQVFSILADKLHIAHSCALTFHGMNIFVSAAQISGLLASIAIRFLVLISVICVALIGVMLGACQIRHILHARKAALRGVRVCLCSFCAIRAICRAMRISASTSSLVNSALVCSRPGVRSGQVNVCKRVILQLLRFIELVIVWHDFIHAAFKPQLPQADRLTRNLSGIIMAQNLLAQHAPIRLVKDRKVKVKNFIPGLRQNVINLCKSYAFSKSGISLTNETHLSRVLAHPRSSPFLLP
nr:MAG TPA: hypothetical protein [Caudoviricetes sp.]